MHYVLGKQHPFNTSKDQVRMSMYLLRPFNDKLTPAGIHTHSEKQKLTTELPPRRLDLRL